MASFPLEMHLVHQSEDGQIAVTCFLFIEGEESEFLAQVITFSEELSYFALEWLCKVSAPNSVFEPK